MSDFQMRRLAQAMMGPREGKLTPENEGAYQSFMAFDPNVRAWRNGFQDQYGEQPETTNDPSFDYRQAFMAGNKPQPYEGDGYHWDSRGKAPDHPTEWMNTFQQQFGVSPESQAQAGLTQPQSQMVNDQLSSDMLARLIQGMK